MNIHLDLSASSFHTFDYYSPYLKFYYGMYGMTWKHYTLRVNVISFLMEHMSSLSFYFKRAITEPSQLGNKNSLHSFTMTISNNNDKKRTHPGRRDRKIMIQETWPKELYAQLFSTDVGRQRILWDLGKAKGRKRLNNLNFMIDLFIVPGECLWFPWQLPCFSLWENKIQCLLFFFWLMELSHGYAKLFKLSKTFH